MEGKYYTDLKIERCVYSIKKKTTSFVFYSSAIMALPSLFYHIMF